jgi:hypothetical protein
MKLRNINCAENVSKYTNHESHTGVDQSDSNFIAMLEYEAGKHNFNPLPPLLKNILQTIHWILPARNSSQTWT